MHNTEIFPRLVIREVLRKVEYNGKLLGNIKIYNINIVLMESYAKVTRMFIHIGIYAIHVTLVIVEQYGFPSTYPHENEPIKEIL
jgi:hypothetical protein